MKNRIQIVLATMVVSVFVCTVASAAGFVSADESVGWQYCDVPGEVAYSLDCDDGYCAAISSDCDVSFYPMTTDTATTAYFSEEQGQMECPDGYIVQGYDVQGWDGRGDNIALSCLKTLNHEKDTCYWTDWISEEAPNDQTAPSSSWSEPDNNYVECNTVSEFIAGMECDGPWCDNMRLYCCNYKEIVAPVDCTCPDGCDNIQYESAPYQFDGAGEACYFFTDFNYMNNWETEKLDINGEDHTYVYVPSDGHAKPAPVDGGYFIYYNGEHPWSHLEVMW